MVRLLMRSRTLNQIFDGSNSSGKNCPSIFSPTGIAGTPSSGGLFDSLRRFFDTGLATLENRAADSKALDRRLLSAWTPETAKKLPEYQRHGDDIEQALSLARRSAGASK